MNEMTIQVIGGCNTGKSTICEEIGYLLASYGFDVSVNKIMNEEPGFVDPKRHYERLNAIKQKGLKVTVVETQARRDGKYFPACWDK